MVKCINHINNIGKIIGDMRIIEVVGRDQNYNMLYKIKCIKCGNEKIIQSNKLNKEIFHSNKFCKIYIKEYDSNIGKIVNDYEIIELSRITKNGYVYKTRCNICGLEHSNLISNFNRGYATKHEECSRFLPVDKYIKRFKKIWDCMRQRTNNPNYNEWSYYGERGINSDYFEDFIVFYKTMFKSYKDHVDKFGDKNTTLDRINVNGNYDCKNCKWSTLKEQSNNKRTNRYFKYKDKTLTLKEWSELLNLNYQTVMRRINVYGWSIEKALELENK